MRVLWPTDRPRRQLVPVSQLMADESPFRPRGPIANRDAELVLTSGEIEILGRMPWSSNATFLVDITHEDQLVQGVYKPHQGERPLWDFPSGLYKREVAAYELSEALGWSMIPPTVLRDGPLGIGSVQLFIPCDFELHYFHFLEDPAHHLTLQRFCAFDIAANSTDRKGGHIVADAQNHLWGIDNGLTFHAEFKLRTVIWDWASEPIPDEIRADLATFAENGSLSRSPSFARRVRARCSPNPCSSADTRGTRSPQTILGAAPLAARVVSLEICFCDRSLVSSLETMISSLTAIIDIDAIAPRDGSTQVSPESWRPNPISAATKLRVCYGFTYSLARPARPGDLRFWPQPLT